MNREYMNRQGVKHIIISGGGTGGHIFPAISIANALLARDGTVEILFVGALGRMEMELVPAAGYRITGLPVEGLDRKKVWKNPGALIKAVRSLSIARSIIEEFRPDVVVGVGGYASGPLLWAAGKLKIPILIQEQNSYAGITNRILSKKASVICVAYKGMEKYFPPEKILLTGNPVRSTYSDLDKLRTEALRYFRIDGRRPVALVLGGSLGAGSINSALIESAERFKRSEVDWIWQTGRNYFEKVNSRVLSGEIHNIQVRSFIDRMDLAYAAADMIISRSGAGTISELCLVGKPVILVPSPNVAEDHQTKNAMSLVEEGAAVLLNDRDVVPDMVSLVCELASDSLRRESLSENIRKLALPGSASLIASEVLKLAEKE
jgi:UDP-N-acetylglucosamine--N-acetylmuramyl-(pentapeptide) pyrophosphoryl-undecaprenol N-acetylglucosamine transferase